MLDPHPTVAERVSSKKTEHVKATLRLPARIAECYSEGS